MTGTILTRSDVPDSISIDVRDAVDRTLRREAVESVIASLTYREQLVLKARLGWHAPAMTYKSIGKIIGLGGERVRQIYGKAERKLRHETRRYALYAIDNDLTAIEMQELVEREKREKEQTARQHAAALRERQRLIKEERQRKRKKLLNDKERRREEAERRFEAPMKLNEGEQEEPRLQREMSLGTPTVPPDFVELHYHENGQPYLSVPYPYVFIRKDSIYDAWLTHLITIEAADRAKGVHASCEHVN